MKSLAKFVWTTAAGMCIMHLGAVESVWLGKGGDNKWTNAANWSNGVPGLLSGSGAKGDTAVFGAVEEGAATTIDLDGLTSIGYLKVRGATSPKYVFGLEGQLLGLESELITASSPTYSTTHRGLNIAADVVRAPEIKAGVSLTDATEKYKNYFFIANHSTNTLVMGDFGFAKGTSGIVGINLAFAGTGPTKVLGQAITGENASSDYTSLCVTLFSGADVEFSPEFGHHESLPANAASAMYIANYGPAAAKFSVGENKSWRAVPGKFDIQSMADTVFSGLGCFEYYGGSKSYLWCKRSSRLAFDARVVSLSSGTGYAYTMYGDGTVAFNNLANDIKTPLNIQAAGASLLTIESPAIGGGTTAPTTLGTNDYPIGIHANGCLRYTGKGERSTRGLVFKARKDTFINSGCATLDNAGTGPWTFAGAISRENNAPAESLTLTGTSAFPATLASNLSDFSPTNSFSLVKNGSGTWVLTGSCTHTGATKVRAGTLSFGNGINYASPITVEAGAALKVEPGASVELASVAVSGAAYLELGSGSTLSVGTMSDADFARLRVIARPGAKLVRNGNPVSVASEIIEIRDGDTYTNLVALGATVNTNGVLHQMGGSLVHPEGGSVTQYARVINGGFWSMDGGTMTHNGSGDGAGAVMLGYTANSVAAYRQSAGTASVRRIGVGWGSSANQTGEILVSGGALTVREALCVPFVRYRNTPMNQRNLTANVTVEKNGLLDAKTSEYLLTTGVCQTVNVNLNGGTYRTSQIARARKGDSNGLYVNFNGGTFEVSCTTNRPFGISADVPDRITVFERGATVAITANGQYHFTGLFRKPEGKGIASIPMPVAPVLGSLIVQPPLITIEDEEGDGFGASAVCDWDWTTMSYGAPRIVSPGCNYVKPVATFHYGFIAGAAQVVSVPCVLTDDTPASGGLTKRGPGTMTLYGGAGGKVGNDFEGPLVIEQGEVRLYANAIAPGKTVVLKGGSLAFATGVTPLPLKWKFKLGETVNAPGMDITFPEGSVIDIEGTLDKHVGDYVLGNFKSVTGIPALSKPLDPGWSFKLSQNKLRLTHGSGFVFICR